MVNKNLPNQSLVVRDQLLQDAYEQAEFQSWLPIEINQISVGDYSGQIQAVEHNKVGVCRERQNRIIHKRSVMDQELCTVSFFRNAQAHNGFAEYKPTSSSLFFLPTSAELDVYVAANAETVYFCFNQVSLLSKAVAMYPSRWGDPPANLICLEQVNLASLNKLVGHIFFQPTINNSIGLEDKGEVLSNIILEQVLIALGSGCQISPEKSTLLITRRRASDTVKRVLDYTKAQLKQHICPSMSVICTDLQVSERTLQYSFNAILNLSPYTYLRYMRLNGARATLMRPNNKSLTITQVAYSWHFLHMGRFSKDYQQLFNELPSTTLRRTLLA